MDRRLYAQNGVELRHLARGVPGKSQPRHRNISLESSLTAKALLFWWTTAPGDPWLGTPQELYEALMEYVPTEERRYFPANPKSLSDHLRRDAPALRQKGVVVKTGLHQRVRGELNYRAGKRCGRLFTGINLISGIGFMFPDGVHLGKIG